MYGAAGYPAAPAYGQYPAGHVSQHPPHGVADYGYAPTGGYPAAQYPANAAAYPVPVSTVPVVVSPGAGYEKQQPQAWAVPVAAGDEYSSTGAAALAAKGGGYIAEAEKAVRMGFIRKVFLILAAQLVLTFGIVAVFTWSDPVAKFVSTHSGVLIVALVVNIVLLVALSCCPSVAQTFPTNYVCLFLFTLAEGYLVGAVASTYTTESVIMAVGITVVVTLGLSIYAWQTKVDFTGMGAALFAGAMCLLLFGIFAGLFRSRIAHVAYAVGAAFLFCMYLIYDVQLIVGGEHRKHQFSVDQYVFAALNVYLDIVNIFLYMLQLFGDRRNS